MDCAICGKWFSSSDPNKRLCVPCQRKKDAAKTNADRIRAMSDEELAEFLVELADDGNLKIREWLTQPAEEG